MHLIIVGAGRTGKHVIQEATKDGHDVVVIEKEEKVAGWAATHYDCMVIQADASSMDALKEAKAEKADALIATTNDDAVNMLVIMLGKELGIKRLISSVTDEGHIRLFEQMGVDTVESPFRLNGQYLYRAVQRPSVKDFLDLGGGAEIIELTVKKNSPIAGKLIKQLHKENLLPKDARIVAVKRKTDIIIPEGDTALLEGDLVAVLSKQGATEELVHVFK
ncbi:MAG: TrkA family potassium uptake protein [Lewinellaceae bacterium]|nr:TrkA family potassium uptake protein [Saprospiraceae bacterium]MCB9337958.1 TrkA family potassium uptake protein [Lewinellaceae bacterium]